MRSTKFMMYSTSVVKTSPWYSRPGWLLGVKTNYLTIHPSTYLSELSFPQCCRHGPWNNLTMPHLSIFSSRWYIYIYTLKSPYAFHHVSLRFPQCCRSLKQFQSVFVWLTMASNHVRLMKRKIFKEDLRALRLHAGSSKLPFQSVYAAPLFSPSFSL